MPEFIHIQVQIAQHPSQKDLPDADRELIAAAIAAAEKAYAPYSLFQVGAGLRLSNGKLVYGSNQENASFPAGICAERTALHAAMSQFNEEKVMEMAVVVITGPQDRPVSPCGICRQALLEQERRQGGPIRLMMAVPDGPVYEVASAGHLLPMSFDGSFLRS